MKSKIVRGIINGGVLAAVAALGITVYQFGTKPIAENPQEENSAQVEETGLEEELSDGENAEDAAAAGDGWQDAVQDEISDGENGDEAGLSGASEAGADADGVTGSIRETAGSGTAENAVADADNGSGTEDRSVSAAAGAEGADISNTEGTGNTADNAGNAAAEGAVNNGAGASTDTAETSAVGIAAQALDFTEDSIMEWPVRGTVLVDYNMDETVYYPTLDQYRVSPAIALQAVEDAPVYAAADGQVLSVVQDACTGTTVTMELGNGYQAVYGQLKDLTVAEGDTVKEGEVIGNISAPTKYYSVEGPNLYFAMKKDGVPVDPFEYLE